MADQAVPVRRTTFTVLDYASAVLKAWKRLCDVYPSRESVACLWAQYAHETGRGAFCWNFNIGNVKYTPGHDYMMLRGTWEIINGKRVVFEPPHRATWFNAYDSLDAAMAEHLKLLKEKQYRTAWPAIERGEPTEFAARLKMKGYYTAPLEQYAAALRAHFAEFMRLPAYVDALEAILRAQEEDTNPDLYKVSDSSPPETPVEPTTPADRPTEIFSIVHPKVPLGLDDPALDDDGEG